MPQVRYAVLAALLLIPLLPGVPVAAVPGSVDGCTLRVGWTPYAIYTFSGDDGSVQGIDADLIAMLAEDIGCATQFRQLPWARILLELQNGTLDVTTSASRSADRERFALFSAPYRLAEIAIYVRQGEAARYPLATLADVAGARMRLGYVVGYYYGREFEALMQDPGFRAHTDGAGGYEVNITKLLHNRIDGLIVDDVGVMIGWAKKLNAQALVERHPLAMPGDDLHFMFSKASVPPATRDAINRALDRARADGRLQAILDRYLN